MKKQAKKRGNAFENAPNRAKGVKESKALENLREEFGRRKKTGNLVDQRVGGDGPDDLSRYALLATKNMNQKLRERSRNDTGEVQADGELDFPDLGLGGPSRPKSKKEALMDMMMKTKLERSE
eukprot:gene8071-7444_t